MIIGICDDTDRYCEEIAKELERYYFTGEGKAHELQIYIYHSGEELLATQEELDLLFLDIELGSMKGFDIQRKYEMTGKNTYIIYITSYTDYRDEAYNTNVIGFLEKPIMQEKLKFVMDKAVQKIGQTMQMILIHGEKILTTDILYVKAEHQYCVVMRKNSKKIYRISLREMEELLENMDFFKVNKSCLVNLHYSTPHGEYVNIGETSIKIAVRRKQAFRNEYLEYLSKNI
jgi:DNA-binding LytR/AlgR family response regulator